MSNRNLSFSRLLSKVSIVTTAFFLTTSAFAVDSGAIEPDHVVNDSAYGAVVSAPTTTAATMQPVREAQETVQYHQKRVYYARSMTANNPEYKTRFSILHETPSPKRIGGERLYNLSDEIFRLEVDGNDIRFLDSPVFKLTGINSAKGRYGEIQLHEGGLLKIQGTSNRFRGKWDVDGTGERLERVTPTNLVSGDIPATLRTFNKDGSARTHEDYTLTFKAMAMGPYNGYWTDGTSMGIWLWGMSKKKTESGEFTYVGLDLGIITLPGDATSTVGDATGTAGSGALAPIEPLGGTTNSVGGFDGVAPTAMGGAVTGGVPTAFGGNGGNSFIGGGGGFGVVPFPIGGGGNGGDGGDGGDGEVVVIIKQFCQENPEDLSCRPLCERFPNDTSCKAPCDAFPNDPTCLPRCDAFPNDPACQENLCDREPNNPSCRPLCDREPNNPRCQKLCDREPEHPRCDPIKHCEKNPNHPDCRPFCERMGNSNHPDCKQCPDGSTPNPATGQCDGIDCTVNIDHPDCKTTCPDGSMRNPVTGQCDDIDCTVNIDHPDCKTTCPDGSMRDPVTGLCDGGTDGCLEDPTLPECKPTCTGSITDPETCNPGTGVPAPWGLAAILFAFAGFMFRRRK